jgi:universal stress protein E
MNRLKSVLVGVDFSECSKAALQQAARMAKWNGATLHVLHVIDSLAVTELAAAMKVSVDQQRQTALTGARHELTRWLGNTDSLERFKTDIIIGVPLEEILKRIGEVNVDLVVLGATGATGAARGAGMLATKVLRKAATKVLLVTGTQMQPFKTVVACVDFSSTAREVIEQAERVAAQDKSHVHFLHVYYGPWHRLHYRMETPEASPDFQKQYRDMLQRQLDEFVGHRAAIEGRCVLHDASSYGHGLAEYAGKVSADLIILGNKGRTNLRYVLLGSTAERLLTELPCSVLRVRAPEGANS